MEVVDTRDLKSLDFGRAGSSPAARTKFRNEVWDAQGSVLLLPLFD